MFLNDLFGCWVEKGLQRAKRSRRPASSCFQWVRNLMLAGLCGGSEMERSKWVPGLSQRQGSWSPLMHGTRSVRTRGVWLDFRLLA